MTEHEKTLGIINMKAEDRIYHLLSFGDIEYSDELFPAFKEAAELYLLSSTTQCEERGEKRLARKINAVLEAWENANE